MLLCFIQRALEPFLISFVFIYILDPIVSYVDKRTNFSRSFITFVTLMLTIVLFCFSTAKLIPFLYAQVSNLILKLMSYKSIIINKIIPDSVSHIRAFSEPLAQTIESSLSGSYESMVSLFNTTMIHLGSSSIGAFGMLSLAYIVPIIIFYGLKDWPRVIDGFYRFVPKKFSKSTISICRDIRLKIICFIKGQFLVSTVLSVFYASSLYFLGLDDSLVLGIIAGFLVFIPYIGSAFAFALCLIMVVLQFGLLSKIGLLIAIFAVAQILENGVLVPKFVGEGIGLHPIWLIFGLFSFAALFGLTGIIFSMPLTAAAGVVIKFLLAKYYKSHFYKGG